MNEADGYHLHYIWTKRVAICPSLVGAGHGGGVCPRRRKIHNSRSWVIDYTFHDYGLFRGGGSRATWQPRPPHVLHLYPPGLDFWEDTRRVHGEYRMCWIFFIGGDEVGLNSYIPAPYGYALFEDPAQRLGTVLDRIGLLATRDREPSYWRCQALLCELIELLGQAYRVKEERYRLDSEGADRPDTLTAQIENLLAANLTEPLGLADITRRLAMSKTALYKRLRAETNETITQMSMRLRIAEAKRLLLQDYPLKEIAARTGFCNSFYLSATFKRQEGISPRDFRKLMKQL